MPQSNWASVPQVLSLQATTIEALEPVLCNKRSHHIEKLSPGNYGEAPYSLQLEISCNTNKDEEQPKLTNKF